MLDLHKEAKGQKVRNLFLLLGPQIDYYWPEIMKGLEEVPGFYDYYSPEWAYERAKMGLLQIWALSDGEIRAIVLTQISYFPRRTVFEIMAAFGVELLAFMEEMQDVFERFAAQNGCTTFGASCRPGLARLLKKSFRAEESYIALRRPVALAKES